MIFENTGKKSWNELDDNTKGLILLAWHNGLQIQYWNDIEKEWHDEDNIEDCAYSPFLGYGHQAFRIKPEPVKQVHWGNDYKDGRGVWYLSREAADRTNLMRFASVNRIAVIRREIVDGVVSYFKEDV